MQHCLSRMAFLLESHRTLAPAGGVGLAHFLSTPLVRRCLRTKFVPNAKIRQRLVSRRSRGRKLGTRRACGVGFAGACVRLVPCDRQRLHKLSLFHRSQAVLALAQMLEEFRNDVAVDRPPPLPTPCLVGQGSCGAHSAAGHLRYLLSGPALATSVSSPESAPPLVAGEHRLPGSQASTVLCVGRYVVPHMLHLCHPPNQHRRLRR